MPISKGMRRAIEEYEKGIAEYKKGRLDGTIPDLPGDPLDGHGVTKKQGLNMMKRLGDSNFRIPGVFLGRGKTDATDDGSPDD